MGIRYSFAWCVNELPRLTSISKPSRSSFRVARATSSRRHRIRFPMVLCEIENECPSAGALFQSAHHVQASHPGRCGRHASSAFGWLNRSYPGLRGVAVVLALTATATAGGGALARLLAEPFSESVTSCRLRAAVGELHSPRGPRER